MQLLRDRRRVDSVILFGVPGCDDSIAVKVTQETKASDLIQQVRAEKSGEATNGAVKYFVV